MIRIGQRLQEERIKKGYSLEDVAKATKIRVEFLKGIESGNYASFPPITYVQGFVKNYIDFLDLPERPLLALFRREFNEKEYIKVLPENLSANREISLNKVRIKQAAIIGMLCLVLLFAYIFLQYRSAFFSPRLSLSYPMEHAQLLSQSVLVVGATDPNATVTIDNVPVVVDGSGNFRKEISVFTGINTVTVKSTNAFGKTSVLTRHIHVSSSS